MNCLQDGAPEAMGWAGSGRGLWFPAPAGRGAYAGSGLSGRSSRRTRMAASVTMSASTVAAPPMVSAAGTPVSA
jgi:hypothetical protein